MLFVFKYYGEKGKSIKLWQMETVVSMMQLKDSVWGSLFLRSYMDRLDLIWQLAPAMNEPTWLGVIRCANHIWKWDKQTVSQKLVLEMEFSSDILCSTQIIEFAPPQLNLDREKTEQQRSVEIYRCYSHFAAAEWT